MGRTALFTGAGASKAIGYPLTVELLPRVRDEINTRVLFKGINSRVRNREDRDQLHAFLMQLYPGFATAPRDKLPLITDVFSLVEYSLSVGEALPIGGEQQLRRCRDLLKQAITDVLLGDFLENWEDSNAEHMTQKATLNALIQWFVARGDQIGMVTTNYDIGFEYALYKKRGRKTVYETIDLGYDWRHIGRGDERRRPKSPGIRVYKLHGSLDTLRCSTCGYVYFNPWGAIAFNAFRDRMDSENTCHCRNDVRLDLHIVSPSIVREVRDANLLSVWRSALEWMRLCNHWVIVGYGLPPEDLGVRSLLTRAYMTAVNRPKVTVVQRGDGARAAYELLFPGCHYVSKGLESFLNANR